MTLEKRSAQSGIARSQRRVVSMAGEQLAPSVCCRWVAAFGDVRLHCAFAQEVTNVR